MLIGDLAFKQIKEIHATNVFFQDLIMWTNAKQPLLALWLALWEEDKIGMDLHPYNILQYLELNKRE
jgi:hypothetical protein